MAKNKQLNLIAIVKMLNISFISKHIINLGIGGGIQYYLITIHLPQNFFSLVPSQLFFSIKYIRNRLLRVSFLEL